MNYRELKRQVYEANMALKIDGLVVLTWGNASGVDRNTGVFAIKPSGVSYDALHPNQIVVVSLADGAIVEGELSPSSDTPTHLVLYREFPDVGGVVHTHSPYATSWAQAALPIPCLGTTHADHFYGDIPITRQLTATEIETAYEENTGVAIAEYFIASGRNAMQTPGALFPFHGPFSWGKDPIDAAKNALVLEEVAKMAFFTFNVKADAASAPKELVDKHFLRKHGPDAYYGQRGRKG